MTKWKIHPLCSAFPNMSAEEYESLKADMRENGQREPITVHGGHVVDGRNRLRACQELKLKIKTRKWDGRGSLVAFVVGMNINRRHLDASQRAMIAAELATLRPGEHKSNTPNGVAQSEAAGIMGASVRAVSRAAAVKEDGAPQLVEAVKSGDVPVSLAAQAVKSLPTAAQVKAMRSDKPAAALREAVKAAEPKPAKPPKSGREKVGPEARKAALTAFGALCRALQKIGKYESCLDRLEWIHKEIKA